MKSAINMAWEHGGADFQSQFDKSTTQAQEIKSGGATVLEAGVRQGDEPDDIAKGDLPGSRQGKTSGFSPFPPAAAGGG